MFRLRFLLVSFKQSEGIEAFSSMSRYLDGLLNIDNKYFEGLVSQFYPSELRLNKANSTKTENPFFLFAFVCCRWFYLTQNL